MDMEFVLGHGAKANTPGVTFFINYTKLALQIFINFYRCVRNYELEKNKSIILIIRINAFSFQSLSFIIRKTVLE